LTPKQLIAARTKLGKMAGLDRPLSRSELGRMLRLKGKEPGQSVRKWEEGSSTLSGPASVAIELMLAGNPPPDGWTAVLRGEGK